MQPVHPLSDCIDMRRFELSLGCVVAEQALLREFAHPDRVLENLAFSVQPWRFRGSADRDQVEIDARCEPTIQAQFLAAVILPFIKRGKIEKAEVDRLLDFVSVASRQNDPGNMRFEYP